MSPAERRALIEQMGQDFMRRLDEHLPEGPLTLDQIETLVEGLAQHQNAALEERLLQEQPDPPTNQACCPECRGPARYHSTQARHVLTIHGSRRLCRRYYICCHCGHGFAPLDALLQCQAQRATRRVRAWEAELASKDPFADVPGTLLLLRGLVVSESTVERTTIAVGTALRAAHTGGEGGPPTRAATAPTPGGDPAGPPPVGRGPGVGRLYLGLDGAFCPLREPWKKDGSRGKLVCRYGEAKVGVVYQTEQRDGLDEGVRWCAYTATLQSIAAFTPEVVALARSHGSDRARELVVLGDGAEWIWNLATQHFPHAVQIVDYWHMTEHLYAVAKARFGAGSDAGKQWVSDCQWYLDHDLPACVLNKIAEWQPAAETDRKLREREYGYFEKNQERMRYRSFLARGYHVGSGVIESGCKRLVTRRMKEAGMHWREETAEAVLAIRARLKSTAPTDLRQYA
jgi:hypothetical protein